MPHLCTGVLAIPPGGNRVLRFVDLRDTIWFEGLRRI